MKWNERKHDGFYLIQLYYLFFFFRSCYVNVYLCGSLPNTLHINHLSHWLFILNFKFYYFQQTQWLIKEYVHEF